MKITDELVKAYSSTEYKVFAASGTIVLRENSSSSELLELHKLFGVNCSALITAYNPHSDRLEDAINKKHHARLISQVSKQWKHLQAEGVGLASQWPAEPSILVLGINLEDALALGRIYQQHAILFASEDKAKLYACRPENKKYFSEH